MSVYLTGTLETYTFLELNYIDQGLKARSGAAR